MVSPSVNISNTIFEGIRVSDFHIRESVVNLYICANYDAIRKAFSLFPEYSRIRAAYEH